MTNFKYSARIHAQMAKAAKAMEQEAKWQDVFPGAQEDSYGKQVDEATLASALKGVRSSYDEAHKENPSIPEGKVMLGKLLAAYGCSGKISEIDKADYKALYIEAIAMARLNNIPF